MNGQSTPAFPTTIVVGIRRTDYGRECAFHAGCGFFLKIGTKVTFMREVFEGKEAVAVYAIFVQSKSAPCRVGWVAKELVDLENWEAIEGSVSSFLAESSESEDRRQHYAKHGAAEISLRAKQNAN